MKRSDLNLGLWRRGDVALRLQSDAKLSSLGDKDFKISRGICLAMGLNPFPIKGNIGSGYGRFRIPIAKLSFDANTPKSLS
jgi:hypothetical protein